MAFTTIQTFSTPKQHHEIRPCLGPRLSSFLLLDSLCPLRVRCSNFSRVYSPEIVILFSPPVIMRSSRFEAVLSLSWSLVPRLPCRIQLSNSTTAFISVWRKFHVPTIMIHRATTTYKNRQPFFSGLWPEFNKNLQGKSINDLLIVRIRKHFDTRDRPRTVDDWSMISVRKVYYRHTHRL